jgi:hypothetical protein
MKKYLVFAVVAIVVMIGFSACREPVVVIPTVTESKIVDRGADDMVAVNVTTSEEGANIQELSYKSWVEVQGVAARTGEEFDKTVTAHLNGKLQSPVTQKIEVEDISFAIDAANVVVSQRAEARGVREEGNVTITDSVLVCTFAHSGFTLVYELSYEVPVYDDGYTKEVMPYYRYENIVDKGDTVVQGKYIVVDEKAYSYNVYQHTLEVTFNGKPYTLQAEVQLLREFGGDPGEPFITSSEVTFQDVVEFDDFDIAVISVQRVWSDGTTEGSSISADLYRTATLKSETPLTVYDYNGNFSYVSSEVTSKESYLLLDVNQYVHVVRHSKVFKVNYSQVSLEIEVIGDEAYYDDGVLYHIYNPNNTVGNIEYVSETLQLLNSGVDSGQNFAQYGLTVNLNVQYGERIMPISVYTEVICYSAQ